MIHLIPNCKKMTSLHKTNLLALLSLEKRQLDGDSVCNKDFLLRVISMTRFFESFPESPSLRSICVREKLKFLLSPVNV